METPGEKVKRLLQELCEAEAALDDAEVEVDHLVNQLIRLRAELKTAQREEAV